MTGRSLRELVTRTEMGTSSETKESCTIGRGHLIEFRYVLRALKGPIFPCTCRVRRLC